MSYVQVSLAVGSPQLHYAHRRNKTAAGIFGGQNGPDFVLAQAE